jgi:hypothetical protein
VDADRGLVDRLLTNDRPARKVSIDSIGIGISISISSLRKIDHIGSIGSTDDTHSWTLHLKCLLCITSSWLFFIRKFVCCTLTVPVYLSLYVSLYIYHTKCEPTITFSIYVYTYIHILVPNTHRKTQTMEQWYASTWFF